MIFSIPVSQVMRNKWVLFLEAYAYIIHTALCVCHSQYLENGCILSEKYDTVFIRPEIMLKNSLQLQRA